MLYTSSIPVGCGTASLMPLWPLTLHFVHGHYMTNMFSPPNPNPKHAKKNSRVTAMWQITGDCQKE